MPLPALRANGTLPLGVHSATLDKLFAAFPGTTAKRLALNDALTRCVDTIKRLNLASQIAVDGSYITDKPDPEDIDMVVLTPDVYQMEGEQHFAAEGIDILLLDIQFARDIVEFDDWLAFFSIARNHAPKGVVLLTY